jgi:type I restriction enzyme R subunit
MCHSKVYVSLLTNILQSVGVSPHQIVDRVVKGYPKKGLIWHFQGSGKSLLMVFAARKLRMHPTLGNPTVMIVVDRIDLDTQITATFNPLMLPTCLTWSE